MPCALCKLERPLVKSHIVPEFLHRPLYDPKHRTVLLDGGGLAPRTIQKGLRERLLCKECERRLQGYEDYFARFWCQGRSIPEEVDWRERVVTFDYRQLKLLLLSIVWRASVCRLPEFRTVTLAKHEDAIRRMVFEERPGSYLDYPVYGGLIVDLKTKRVCDALMLVPLKLRVGTHWAIRMVFAGVAWTVLTSSHQSLPIEEKFLKEDGQLTLLTLSWAEFAKESGVAKLAYDSVRRFG